MNTVAGSDLIEKEILERGKIIFWTSTLAGYVIVILLSLYLSTKSTTISGFEWNWGLALLLALILYTMASFIAVEPSYIGIRLFYEYPVDQAGPGPTFVPYGIFTLKLLNNEDQQAELPAEAEDVYEGSELDPDGKNIPDGKVPPIRIVFGPPDDPKTTDPYDQRMVAKVTPVIRYRISNGVIFIQRIGTWDNARVQIEDAVVAVLHEELSKVTPAKALTMLSGPDGLYKKLEDTLDALLASWGVDLLNISLKPFGYSHKLNEAVLEVPRAQRTAVATIIAAEAEEKRLTHIGAGEGSAIRSRIEGKTAGLKDMLKELGLDGPQVLAAETAVNMTNNPGQKTLIVGAEGVKNILAMGATLGEAFESAKPKPIILLPEENKK